MQEVNERRYDRAVEEKSLVGPHETEVACGSRHHLLPYPIRSPR